jgi:DNA-binding NarL/FixJ family response regulator
VRERQIASLLKRGLSQKAIAFELQIAPSTVSFHVRNLSRRLSVRSVAELVTRLTG